MKTRFSDWTNLVLSVTLWEALTLTRFLEIASVAPCWGQSGSRFPRITLRGIDLQKYDFEVRKWPYLCGQQKLGGWYHYYVYALAVKTPLGALLILALAGVLIVCRREYASHFRNELVLLAPALAVLVLVSSQTGFNRYLRYVLPEVPFLFIFASRVGKSFALRHSLLQASCGICVVATVVEGMSVFPHSMSFFNQTVGGPLGGPAHLLDANVDWGQDLLQLKRFVNQHPEVGAVGLAYFGFADPALARFPYSNVPTLYASDGETRQLKAGWYAISVNHLFGYRHNDGDTPVYTYFQRISPNVMAGYSIYIYRVTPEVLERLYETPRTAKKP